jgi:hypothetical protein
MPPPTEASTTSSASSRCRRSCICCACFISFWMFITLLGRSSAGARRFATLPPKMSSTAWTRRSSTGWYRRSASGPRLGRRVRGGAGARGRPLALAGGPPADAGECRPPEGARPPRAARAARRFEIRAAVARRRERSASSRCSSSTSRPSSCRSRAGPSTGGECRPPAPRARPGRSNRLAGRRRARRGGHRPGRRRAAPRRAPAWAARRRAARRSRRRVAALAAPHDRLSGEQLLQQAQQVLVAGRRGEGGERGGASSGQVDRAPAAAAQRQVQGVAAVGEELAVDAARVPALVLELAAGAEPPPPSPATIAASRSWSSAVSRPPRRRAASSSSMRCRRRRWRAGRAAPPSRARCPRRRGRSGAGRPRGAIPSASQMGARWAATSSAGTRRKWNSWQRERMVAGTASASVVAKTKTRCGGGSSTILSRASKAWRDRRWISSSTTTL